MAAASFPIPDDTLLLCLDMQAPFVRVMAQPEALQKRCALAVAAAAGLGLPVAFTDQVPEKLGGTLPDLLRLAPQAAVWPKHAFSALADDAIHDALRHQRNVQHLLLCGIETPICVYQTAVAALTEGLHVTVLSDAVGARRESDARVCLEALARDGVHVLPTETVFYSLLRDVSHPFFRPYTQLVKSAS